MLPHVSQTRLFLFPFLLTAVMVGTANAYVPILTTHDNLVRWDLDEGAEDQPNVIEGAVEFFTNRAGIPDIGDDGNGKGGEFEILRKAFRTWEKVSTSLVDFNDLRLTDQTLLSSNDMTNVIAFDETNSTGLFPEGTGIIALTLLTYDDEEYDGRFDGRIRDADLIFNARDFVFGEKAEADRMDLLSVATHEIGHICGLDHNFFQHTDEETLGLTVATMYPYLHYGDTQVRTLETDDIAGVTALYPYDELNRKVNGSLSGRVTVAAAGKQFGEGTPMFGVDIVAYRDDVPVAGTISRTDGIYRILGVPEGTYILRAIQISPLNVNLPRQIDFAFQSQYYPAAGLSTDASPITVVAGKRRFDFNFELPLSTKPDFFEPNNSAAQATLLATDGRRMIHQFYTGGDEDWIRIDGQRGVTYDLVTDNLAFFSDPFMELYAANGTTLLDQDDDLNAGLGNAAARIRFTAPESGPFFVRLTESRGLFGGGTSFEFSVREVAQATKYDTNGDGQVDSLDLLEMGTHWKGNLLKENSGALDVDSGLLLEVIEALREEN